MPSQPAATRPVIIIGAGIAGLSTGVYAQVNGYQSRIFELHDVPGGLMTAWKRKGYTIDGCIHWLTGSSPSSSFYPLWEDIGLIQDRPMFNPQVFSQYESADGQIVTFYTQAAQLEKHLLELAPEDTAIIKNFCSAIRACASFDLPIISRGNFLQRGLGQLKVVPGLIQVLPHLLRYGNLDFDQFSTRFKNPFLRETFKNMWYPDLPVIALIFTLGWLNNQAAGYPLGGSLPMARAVEKRYTDLGGQIIYSSRVSKILIEGGKAVGIRLEDGHEEYANVVISAADGHATIFDLLEGRFVDEKIRQVYQDYKVFPPILLIGLGVNRTFDNLPQATGGFGFYLQQPIQVGPDQVQRLDTMIYNFDPSLAPAGKTILTVTIPTQYTYWKELSVEPELYETEKKRIALEVIQRLDQRFPGLAPIVEMADIATPMTFERYTGNWQASFEGFLPTPKNIRVAIPKTLPGLQGFYMVGQWVQAGGGLPSGVSTAREVVQLMCKKDNLPFKG